MTEDVRSLPPRILNAAGGWLARRGRPTSPQEDAQFVAWLTADPRHEVAYAEVQRNMAEGGLLALSEVGRTRKLERAPFYMRHKTQMAAASLGIVVLLGIGTVSLWREGSPFTIVSPAQAATYETRLGEIRTVSLADGSQLTLDTATRVRVSLSGSERRVSLERGRARFRVATNKGHPFRVDVPGGSVTAVGTVFDVSVEGASPRIAVLDGRVDLSGTSGLTSRAVRTLSAGEVSEIDSSSRVRPLPAGEGQWVSGMLALDASPLGEAVATINRYNQVQICLDQTELARLSVTGAFQVRDPETFAQAVATTFDLIIDRPGPDVILLRAKS